MAALPVQVRRRLITVVEYEQMIQAGVFPEDDRLELIESVAKILRVGLSSQPGQFVQFAGP